MRTKCEISRRIVGVFLCLALVFSFVPMTVLATEASDGTSGGAPIYVGGEPLLDGQYLDNAGNITDTAPEDDGYAYYKDGELTLCNYIYAGGGYEYDSEGDDRYSAAIYSENDITVNLVGFNELSLTYGMADPENPDDPYKYGEGLYSNSSVTVTGDGILHINADYGIDAEKDVTVEDVFMLSITAVCDGIYTIGGDVNIIDSSVNITADRDGIYAYDGSVNIKCTEVTLSDPSSAPEAVGTDVVINSGEDAHAVFAYEKLTVDENLTVSVPEGGSAGVKTAEYDSDGDGVNDTEYEYMTVVDADGNAANSITVEPLVYNIYIKELAFDVAIIVPVGKSALEVYGRELLDVLNLQVDKDGYTFTGWYTEDASQYDFDAPVTADAVISPAYTVNKYTVTYKADGETVATVEVEHGADAAAPEIPEKDGYSAVWDNDGKAITADTEINAVYTEIPVTELPTDTEASTDTETSTDTDAVDAPSDTTPTAPQTGEDIHMTVWFVLMLASGIVVTFVVYGRKRSRSV